MSYTFVVNRFDLVAAMASVKVIAHGVDGSPFGAVGVPEINEVLANSFTHDKPRVPSVATVDGRWHESDVTWLVVTVVVDTVDVVSRYIVPRQCDDVRQERDCAFSPFVAHGYSTTAVVLISVVLFIVATLKHSRSSKKHSRA